jgi:hypothetical protein
MQRKTKLVRTSSDPNDWVKFTLEQAAKTSKLDGVGGQHHAPATLPPGKKRNPLYRRLGRPQALSGQVRKISPPPAVDPRTVQSVASRYIDWASPIYSDPNDNIAISDEQQGRQAQPFPFIRHNNFIIVYFESVIFWHNCWFTFKIKKNMKLRTPEPPPSSGKPKADDLFSWARQAKQ